MSVAEFEVMPVATAVVAVDTPEVVNESTAPKAVPSVLATIAQ